MRLLFRNNMMLIASLSVLLLLLVNQNAFCDEELPEDPLPERVERILFSPCNLTNGFYGILESSPDISEPWIHILPQGTNENFIVIYADSTNILQGVRSQSICSFQLGSTNENCHVSVNEILVCFWDETADEKGENEDLVKFCKKLEFDCKTDGVLFESPNASTRDEDVYYLTTNGKSGFCFEVEGSDALDYEVSFDQGSWKSIKKIQLLNKNGNDIPNHFRLYVTNKIDGVQYSFLRIKRNNSSAHSSISYSITPKKVRPLLLVHGIRSEPTYARKNYIVDDEDEDEDDMIAFYFIYKEVSSWEEFNPVIPFPFPWNSYLGSYESYCTGGNSLNTFYKNKAETWYLGPVIMAHSMGGLLSVKQIQLNSTFASLLYGLVCLGSPFCGSDLGNSTVGISHYFSSLIDTSSDNIIYLSRGSSYVLSRMSSFPDIIKTLPYKEFIYSEISNDLLSPLCYFSGEGDGIVSYCSSNVGETLQWQNCNGKKSKLNHLDMHKLVLKKHNGEYRIIYDSLKNLLNQ